MNYNSTSEAIKQLFFDQDARNRVINGVNKLEKAVSSTMGAGGSTCIYEDGVGVPQISKDGVTVARSVILKDSVESIGAELVKQAANNTLKEAGDSTTNSIVLSAAILNNANDNIHFGTRALKDGIFRGLEKVNKYLESVAIPINKKKLVEVASISANNDYELGKIIGDAFNKVGKDGVVIIEDSDNNETYADIIKGVQIKSPLKSKYFQTNHKKEVCELENPLVLISESPIPNIRRIKVVLEEIARTKRPLLIIGKVEDEAMKVLMANNIKGNIKVNVIEEPSMREIKRDVLEDLAIITGATVVSEALGDDMDLIKLDQLGSVVKSVTDNKSTVLVTEEDNEDLTERIELVRMKIKEETNPYLQKKLEGRLGMLSGSVGVIYVGADSEVELKEKKDRVDDAVHATKSALNGGIVSGGGVALRDASNILDATDVGEMVLRRAIQVPFVTILRNAGYADYTYLSEITSNNIPSWKRRFNKWVGYKFFDSAIKFDEGEGVNVIDGTLVNMVDANIIDPLSVIKSALKNAVSVSTTIMSANCVIANERIEG